jgi:hypothetical protein
MTIEVIFPKKQIITETGGGGGIPTADMLKSVYDPDLIEADAFDMANMKEAVDAKIMTADERENLEEAYTHSQEAHAPADAEANVNADWNAVEGDALILNKPSLLSLGETETTAYRGDRGKMAYDHSQEAHAPSNAQKNSDITKEEIEAKLIGEISSHSHAAAERGFAIYVLAASFSPTDLTNYFFGVIPLSPTAFARIRKIYIRKICTLKIAEIVYFAATPGTNEDISLYVRHNDTTDYLIATVGLSNNERIFSNTNMNLEINPGDYIEIKMVCPNWATNPATTMFGGYLYFQLP